jgi:hypothetical protein
MISSKNTKRGYRRSWQFTVNSLALAVYSYPLARRPVRMSHRSYKSYKSYKSHPPEVSGTACHQLA